MMTKHAESQRIEFHIVITTPARITAATSQFIFFKSMIHRQYV